MLRTLKSEIERIRNTGKNVIFDVDVKGGIQPEEPYGTEAISVFIMPPVTELEKSWWEGQPTKGKR
jgi:guanylate kinase